MAGGVVLLRSVPSASRDTIEMITSTYDDRVKASLPELRDRISDAALRSGRGSEEVTLVAVTKAHPIEAIQAALSHGLSDLGENRTEELESKRAAVVDETSSVAYDRPRPTEEGAAAGRGG